MKRQRRSKEPQWLINQAKFNKRPKKVIYLSDSDDDQAVERIQKESKPIEDQDETKSKPTSTATDYKNSNTDTDDTPHPSPSPTRSSTISVININKPFIRRKTLNLWRWVQLQVRCRWNSVDLICHLFILWLLRFLFLQLINSEFCH